MRSNKRKALGLLRLRFNSLFTYDKETNTVIKTGCVNLIPMFS